MEKCVGVWESKGRCGEVYLRCREVLGKVWVSVLEYEGRCEKMCGRRYEGCGEMLGEVWKKVLGCREGKGRYGERCGVCGKCFEVWGKVRGGVGKCWGGVEKCVDVWGR